MSETTEVAVRDEQAVQRRGEDVYSAVLAAVNDAETDPDRLEKFLAVAERMEAAQAKRLFVQAFHAAKAELDRVTIKKSGKITYSKGGTVHYAKYEDISGFVKPILHRHGLTARFSYEYIDSPPKVICIMTLAHVAGHSEVFRSVPLPMIDQSGGKSDIQGAGSVGSYGKRYAIVPAFDILTEDEDDDGSGQGVQEPIDDEQADEIERCLALIEEHEPTEGVRRFYDWLGKSHVGSTNIRDIRQGESLEIVMRFLRAKLKRIGGGK